MLSRPSNHTTYCATLPPLDPRVWGEVVAWCRRANWDALQPALTRAAGGRGRPGRDPVALFRTLALQALLGEPSITAWVRRVRQTPALARLCGWTPTTVPAVSTLYAFLARQYPDPDRRRGAVRAPSGRRGPVLAPGEKLPPRRPGAIDRVAARVTRERRRPLRPRVTDRWDALLATVVQDSVRRGALPATWDLAADGTGLVSGAHSFGRKHCACTGRRCRCRRYFSDPTALLGWDSHRHRYFFGHSAQALVVANPVPGQPAHPLVVSLALHPANRHDGVAYPDLLRKTQARYAGGGVTLRRVIADAAYDVTGLWTFTRACGLTPVFAPHTPPTPPALSPAATAAGLHLGPDHRPICAADRPLAPRGAQRPGIQIWACPAQNQRAAPCPTPCAKAHGRVTVNHRGDRYAASGVPYGSPIWRQIYAQRTAVERANSLWASAAVKTARHRRRYLWYGRLVIAAIVEHVKAWGRVAA